MAEEILLRAQELRQVREELGRTNAQLEAAFQAIQDGIIVLDAQGNFVLINEAEVKLAGYESADEMRRNINDFSDIFELRFADGRVVPFDQWPWSRVLRGEVIKDWQLHGLCRDTGQQWHFSFSGQPVRDESGRVTLGVVVTRDITEARNSQLMIQQARDELALVNQELEKRIQERTALLTRKVHELESVSYSLSHDLRAPLRAIRSFAEILQRELRNQGGPRATDLLGRIATAAGRLDDLIQDVLTLSRLNRERIEVKPVDLDKLVKDIINERAWLQPPSAEVDVSGHLLPVVGHEASLSQCFSNLLDNAVKFVKPGVRPKVRVWTERHDGVVRANIEDNGIGIASEHFDRIFDMFQRLHSPGVYEGTGIGLTIVRQAVERMGGTVGVQSAPGKGSRFWLDLPADGKS
jgi:PAS domain S-box-containing protein